MEIIQSIVNIPCAKEECPFTVTHGGYQKPDIKPIIKLLLEKKQEQLVHRGLG